MSPARRRRRHRIESGGGLDEATGLPEPPRRSRPLTAQTEAPSAADLYDLSLVVACYNEDAILEASMTQVFDVLDDTRLSYEVIFVDDASHDRTRPLIDEIIARHPRRHLRRILHERNRGRGRTVTDGFLVARGTVAGYIDIDLEVEAHYIPVCVRAILKGADVATALRTYKFRLRSVDRYVMSKGYAWLMRRLLHLPLVDTETGFKFFRRERLRPLLAKVQADGWFWDTEIMFHAFRDGYRIVEIPCLYVRRFDKPSSVARWRDSVEYARQLWRFRAEHRDGARGFRPS